MSARAKLGNALFPFTIVSATAGCEAAPQSQLASQRQVEDSAGIVVVENRSPAPDSRLEWQVGLDISIGTVEGGDDFQLYRVDDALKLRDGRIVVANGGAHQLLVFDGGGNYLTAWGQRGEGPGDFGSEYGSDGLTPPQTLWLAAWPGDSLAICHGTYTGGHHLLAVWDTQGNHGRTVNLARGDVFSVCRDVSANGSILSSHPLSSVFPTPDESMGLSLHRADHEFLAVAGDGSTTISLGSHPGSETMGVWKEYPFLLMDLPFQKSLVWAAWGELLIVAPTDRYEIRAYRTDGSLARIVRREHDARSPTQEDLDNYRSERMDRGAGSNSVAALEAMPLPESFPAISAIEVDLLGNLWVREYNLPGEEDRALWTVFDPEGLVLGFVETPPDLIIYEIGEDYMLGKVTDELGVEYVQVWGLDRSG